MRRLPRLSPRPDRHWNGNSTTRSRTLTFTLAPSHPRLQDADLLARVTQTGQDHVFDGWFSPGASDADKRTLLEQLRRLDTNYSGGITGYIGNAKRLLEESRQGTNPLEGYAPEVPEGISLDFCSDEYREAEASGAVEAGSCAFVLVAGGLGERLGYSGIKLSLPVDLSSNETCFLQLYIESILELQRRAAPKKKLPLAIMTSDDTHDRTVALLEKHAYFGMDAGQVVLMKQEKVACLADGNAGLAMEGPFTLQTKPHGHGDVHMLLHTLGLADAWRREGFKWVAFFQDTNAQAFHGLLPALGVSAANGFDMNSVAVPRKAKEAIGAITRLRRADGSSMTINVEYNQLDPLLRATCNPEGDVNDPTTGYSPFPGNINQLVMKLDGYCAELQRHGGVIAEFVNPKYADESRTKFKKSTRLECMMQDFPKSLPATAKVGFTTINQVHAAYSPVKNSVEEAQAKAASGNPQHSAASGEFDVYRTNCEMLRHIGCTVDVDSEMKTFNGMEYVVYPRVSWSPRFALTFDDLKARIADPSRVHIGSNTSMYIGRGVRVERLALQRGRLEVRGGDGGGNGAEGEGEVVVDVVVDNDGWTWEPVTDGDEVYRIRGYRVAKRSEAMTL